FLGAGFVFLERLVFVLLLRIGDVRPRKKGNRCKRNYGSMEYRCHRITPLRRPSLAAVLLFVLAIRETKFRVCRKLSDDGKVAHLQPGRSARRAARSGPRSGIAIVARPTMIAFSLQRGIDGDEDEFALEAGGLAEVPIVLEGPLSASCSRPAR